MTKKPSGATLLILSLAVAFLAGCAGPAGTYDSGSGARRSPATRTRVSTPMPSPTISLRLPAPESTSPAGDASTSSSTQGATAYQLRPLDAVMITLRSIPAPQEVEAVIDEEGFVNLPYIGHIRASGMTSSELEQAIQRAYIEGDIYKQVTVNVVIAAQSYYVRGEVKKPGRYPIVSGVTLVRAIAAAAGFTDFANPKKITLIRGDNNRLYNYWDMEDKPEKDVGIEAGDVIVVPRGFL